MNGSQQAKDATAPNQTAAMGASSANGNSTLNKKRKKEGLKPIITTEGPG
jgi:serine/threonine-protein kinase SRPK3